MPIKGSLAAVAAASRLALGPLQAEVADLRRSLAAIQRTLSALPQDDTDSFRQVSWIDPYAARFFIILILWIMNCVRDRAEKRPVTSS